MSAPIPKGAGELPAGLTYRQLDYWSTRGYLRVGSPGSGRPRSYPESERQVAIWMFRLIQAGFTTQAAAEIARQHVEEALVTLLRGRVMIKLFPQEEPTPDALPAAQTEAPAG